MSPSIGSAVAYLNALRVTGGSYLDNGINLLASDTWAHASHDQSACILLNCGRCEVGSMAVISENGTGSVQFGIFEVDLRAGELRRNGSREIGRASCRERV